MYINKYTGLFLAFLINTCACINLYAQTTNAPSVLVVIAHPDDESVFSVTLYKIIKELHGNADLFVITNGEAGFKYATLAEQYYGIQFTEEKIGRANLPRIRKRELLNAGRILGITHYYFEDQLDAHYTLNEREPLDTNWNVPEVKKHLARLLSKKHYNYIFTLLPEPGTHGQHKAATLLALDVLAGLPPTSRPVILGAMTRNKNEKALPFAQYLNYESTKTISETPSFNVDRTFPFSYKGKMNYKVIANWEIAEHKTQGATQMTMNDGDLEEFWYFALNTKEGLTKCADLFNRLKQTPYPSKTY